MVGTNVSTARRTTSTHAAVHSAHDACPAARAAGSPGAGTPPRSAAGRGRSDVIGPLRAVEHPEHLADFFVPGIEPHHLAARAARLPVVPETVGRHRQAQPRDA